MGRECSLYRAEVDVSLRLPSIAALAALSAVSVGPVACGGHASPDDCTRMVDNYIDLAVGEAPGALKMTAGQAAAVREVERGLKRAEPSYRRVQDHCDSVTRSEARCALGASTTAAWEACLPVAHPDAAE
jgi:hypothetical protein